MPPQSSPPSNSLTKNPLFTSLLGLMAALMVLSFFLYTQLEQVPRRDDDMPLGSSGGDGQGFDLRQAEHKRKHHHKNKKHFGASMFGGGGGGPGNMEDAITEFAQFKEDEQRRRLKHGEQTERERYEQEHPYGTDAELRDKVQKELRQPPIPIASKLTYDPYACPYNPPEGYPFTWNIMDVLNNWNPDDTDIPSTIHQGLCVFDWHDDYDTAMNYRSQQLPFVVIHVPEVMKTSVRWTSDGYLNNLLGDEPIRNEHSHNNHFMYWKTRHPTPNYVPPTDMVDLPYSDWHRHAMALQNVSPDQQVQQEHWYFRLNALLEKHAEIYEELPFFDPSLGESMTMIHPSEHRGINCRFGMKGVIAETHFDSSSNFIAIMGGQRRYILAHPDQCVNMELYPQDHPSGRHSSINWSTATKELAGIDRPFVKAQVNEVLLQAGDLLYLPTFWFHFIVSLNTNYQCNSRSGMSNDYEQEIADCGFAPATRQKKKRRKRGLF